MKKLLFLLAVITCSILFAFVPPKDRNIGRWRVTFGDSTKGNAEFKADGTFETRFEKSDFKVGGIYITRDDVLYIADTSCGENYWGKYNQTFYTDDSVLNTLMQDSCTTRRTSVAGSVLVKID